MAYYHRIFACFRIHPCYSANLSAEYDTRQNHSRHEQKCACIRLETTGENVHVPDEFSEYQRQYQCPEYCDCEREGIVVLDKNASPMSEALGEAFRENTGKQCSDDANDASEEAQFPFWFVVVHLPPPELC
jgi:hypothetical protein